MARLTETRLTIDSTLRQHLADNDNALYAISNRLIRLPFMESIYGTRDDVYSECWLEAVELGRLYNPDRHAKFSTFLYKFLPHRVMRRALSRRLVRIPSPAFRASLKAPDPFVQCAMGSFACIEGDGSLASSRSMYHSSADSTQSPRMTRRRLHGFGNGGPSSREPDPAKAAEDKDLLDSCLAANVGCNERLLEEHFIQEKSLTDIAKSRGKGKAWASWLKGKELSAIRKRFAREYIEV